MGPQHAAVTLEMLRNLRRRSNNFVIDGSSLSIPDVYTVISKPGKVQVDIDVDAKCSMQSNATYLEEKVRAGQVIYGVNTGFGGSADVRSPDIEKVQKALVQHLNAGFGETFKPDVVRGVMLVRANSLCRAMSGVRPQIVSLLVEMINHNIVPVVPMRGSVSASGDLMPTSYIAAAMMGRPDSRVYYHGKLTTAPEAFQQAGLTPLTFQAKEALAVLNSSSFSSALGCSVVLDASRCALLTQLATAMSVEALKGRLESFHPTIHHCMPHVGQVEVAHNIFQILSGTKMAITELDVQRTDHDGELKQDRYALRTAAQWLGPVVETLQDAFRRLVVEINSTNDNPVIDHVGDTILHGGNFQGTFVTVAMDQTRQSLQLCGKLLFAQMSELINSKMNGGLSPNLCGSDITTDFGFKGTDTAMASYMSELDWMTPPLTNHVLSAELHNQAVNSLALVSARQSNTALKVLQMMLSNILVAQCQGIDLRWMQGEVVPQLHCILDKHGIPTKFLYPDAFPWYQFVFNPLSTARKLLDHISHIPVNAQDFVEEITAVASDIISKTSSGQHLPLVISKLGEGTRVVYSFIRKTLGIQFNDGNTPLDTDLQKLYNSFHDNSIDNIIVQAFAFLDRQKGKASVAIPMSRL